MKRISRGLPTQERYADLIGLQLGIGESLKYQTEESKSLLYIVELGHRDYIRWKHMKLSKKEGCNSSCFGDDEEHFLFITPEAYFQLGGWIEP